MRIALLGEGTYPITTGGVSTWCDQLVRGLPEHSFDVVTLVGAERDISWHLPGSVSSITTIPMWDPVRAAGRIARHRGRASVHAALAQVWKAAFAAEGPGLPDPLVLAEARAGLRELSRTRGVGLAGLLAAEGSTEHILRAWPTAPGGHRTRRITLAEAAQAAYLSDRMLAVLDRPWPEADLVHATVNGPAALLALARHWHDGTPFILTEHGVYIRERYLALAALNLPWATRYAVMALVRLTCQLAYTDAAMLAPVSDFNARWAAYLGADPGRTRRIHNGVDHGQFPPLVDEPAAPTVSFVGRIDPLKDLHTLVSAFAAARSDVPTGRLRLFGPVPRGNEGYHASVRSHIDALGLDDSVTFEGAVPTSRMAAEAGHVVALSSVSEGLPFTVVEAMMCGRATVSTDVGGVGEVVGSDGSVGLLVPAKDASAMGRALAALLGDDQSRRAMGGRARERALEMFTLDRCLDDFRLAYGHVGEPIGLRAADVALAS